MFPELFLTDTMGKEFDILASWIHERTTIQEIKSVYQTIHRDEAIDGVVVLTLEKRERYTRKVSSRNSRVNFVGLPIRLRVRESLLDAKEANKKIQRTRKLAADF